MNNKTETIEFTRDELIEIYLAIEERVIVESDRFGPHDLRRAGTTDTQGTDEEKMKAGGWSDKSMLKTYDKSIPVVDPVSE